jgi:F-type H+-transporting ATPase subunit alpha
VREILKQGQFRPLRASEQIISLLSVTGGTLDLVPTEKIRTAEQKVIETINEQMPELCERIDGGKTLKMEDRDSVLEKIKLAIAPFEETEEAGANN